MWVNVLKQEAAQKERETKKEEQLESITKVRWTDVKSLVSGLVATWIWVNIGSDNGLVPDGTKPLPEPMLTCH